MANSLTSICLDMNSICPFFFEHFILQIQFFHDFVEILSVTSLSAFSDSFVALCTQGVELGYIMLSLSHLHIILFAITLVHFSSAFTY